MSVSASFSSNLNSSSSTDSGAILDSLLSNRFATNLLLKLVPEILYSPVDSILLKTKFASVALPLTSYSKTSFSGVTISMLSVKA